MSDQILINYEAVYTKCRELRRRLQTEVRDMDGEYRQIQSSLRGMDSRTNAQMMTTVEANLGKAQMTAETLLRLLTSIEDSARATEQEEQRIKQMFNMARTRPASNLVSSPGNTPTDRSTMQNPVNGGEN